jgi:hypothetical protein
MNYPVDITTRRTTDEVLERISAVTEREILPFVSASRYPMQREKSFVARLSGNKFRIWKTPSGSKARQTRYRYLRGEVRDLNGERHLTGSFAIHPFHKVLALIPLAVIALVWFSGRRTVPELIFIFAFCIGELIMVGAAIRARHVEEAEIVEFLQSLFSDAVHAPN